MTDLVRDRILAEALDEIPQTGFSQETLQNAASRAGISRRELNDAFPDGPVTLVVAFSHWADRLMAERVAVESEQIAASRSSWHRRPTHCCSSETGRREVAADRAL